VPQIRSISDDDVWKLGDDSLEDDDGVHDKVDDPADWGRLLACGTLLSMVDRMESRRQEEGGGIMLDLLACKRTPEVTSRPSYLYTPHFFQPGSSTPAWPRGQRYATNDGLRCQKQQQQQQQDDEQEQQQEHDFLVCS
jgi:hypothetical protein